MARLLGRRVALIVESHGDFEVGLFLQRRIRFPALYRWLMQRVARYALNRADLCRAISCSTREQLNAWTPDKQVIQFPAWTDLDQFLEAGKEGCLKKLPTILYAGVLIPGKGVHHLLNGVQKLLNESPETWLIIVGHANNRGYAADLKAQVRQLGLDDRVVFTGEVTQRELASYMGRSLVFVLPSLSEGLGRVVFEAMAVGLPVIASRVGGISEMLEEGVTGFLVPPGDEEALADRLRWVLTHPAEAKEMGQRARAFAQRFFSTEAYARHYAELFAEGDRRRQEAEGRRIFDSVS